MRAHPPSPNAAASGSPPDDGNAVRAASFRLDPFSLPTDTTSRFALLIVAVLTASLFAYNLAAYGLPPTERHLVRADRCTAAAVAALPPSRSPLEAQELVQRAIHDCRRPVERWLAAVIGLGLLGLAGVALGLYLMIPTWKIRRRRLVPLEEEDAPELVDAFRQSCRQVGLRTPRLLWNPLNPGGGALAFGRFSRSYVAVGPGLVVQHYTDPEVASAVLRHELAHLANRDVSKTYLAISLWYGFVLAALLPVIVVLLANGELLTFALLWRLAALVVLVYAARNALLRAREYYADAWAGSSALSRAALTRVLERSPRRRASPWRRFLGVHPDHAARVRTLEDTDRLFHPPLLDVLAAGVLAGFAFPLVREFLFLIVPLEQTLYIGTGAALVSASPIGVVLGTVAWRGALVARARDRGLPSALPLAVAAALGFGLGSELSLVTGRGMGIRSTIVLSAFMLASVHWLVSVADAWFDAVPGTRSGRIFSLAGPVAAALVVWSTGWVSVIGIGERASDESAAFYAGEVASHPFTLYLLAALVLFPIAATVISRPVLTDEVPDWVLEEGALSGDRSWPSRPPLAVARALVFGAAGGGLFCLGVLVLRGLGVDPKSLIKPIDRAAFEFALGVDYAPVTLAVLIQVLELVVVAWRARRLAVLHALLALPPSVLLMTAGIALPHLLDGDGLPFDLGRSARLIATGGALAALLVGGLAGALRRRSSFRGPS